MYAHEPPGTRLTLAVSERATADHLGELREAAEHARLAAVARSALTDRPLDTSVKLGDLLESVGVVLRAARRTAAARSSRAARRPAAAGRHEGSACPTC